MPRQIDSIGRKPEENNIKPVAEHKAGQVFRPRNEGHRAGDVVRPADYHPESEKPEAKANVSAHAVAEHKAQKKAHRATPAGKRRRLLMAVAVAAGILVIGGLAAVISSQKLRDALTKPKPRAGVFAQIGDTEIPQSEYDKLKDAYRKFNSTTGNLQSSDSDRQAADDIITYTALQQAAGPGVQCTANDVDNRFANQYATQGGKEQYLAFVKEKYNWDESTIRARACLAFYEDYAKTHLISHYGLAGVYIRWDTQTNLSQAQQDAYGTAAKARLEKDYLPLFSSGKSKEEIFRTADVNPYQDETVVGDRIADFTQPYTRTLDLGYFTRDQGFNAYAEGDDNWQYIDPLKIGENTPVFKSNSGYYAIYRLTDKVIGQYSSITEIRNAYIKNGKLGAEYYLLPDRSPKVNGGVPSQSTNTEATQQLGLMDRAKSVIIPAAQAAGSIGCWSAHLLGFNITYLDINTGMPISVATPPGAGKGVTNDAAVQAVSTHGSLPTSCSSMPLGNLGNGSSALLFGSNYVVTSDPMASNPMGFFLTCYDSWDWSFTAPTGYQPLTGSDYQAGNRFLVYSTAFGLRWAPSSQSGFYRLPSSLYASIANGPNVNYDIAVYFTPVPGGGGGTVTPVPQPRLMNANSSKRRSDDQSLTGAFSNQNVNRDGLVSSTANPYSFNALTATENHTFSIDPTVPGGAFDFEKWRACFGSRCTEGNSNTYIYAANTAQVGENLELTWYFKSNIKPSTLHLGTLVNDGSGDKNPCDLKAGKAKDFCGASSVTVAGKPAITTKAPSNTADFVVDGDATYNVTLNNPPPGWKVTGYISCRDGAAANCFGSTLATANASNSFTVKIPPDTQRYVYFVIAPDLNISTPTITCSTISGSVTGTAVANLKTQLKLDGTAVGAPVSGSTYSVTVPAEYHDGQSRAVSLEVSYDSLTSTGSTSIDKSTGLNHSCPNDAQCGASFTAEIQNVFGAGKLGDAGLTGINIRVEMKNNGQSTWKSQWAGTSNKHHLSLTQAALDQGWKIQPQSSADITPAATASVAPGGTNSFQIVLEAPAIPLTGSNLQFQMSYLVGANENRFGEICSAPITVRGYYHPWLQVQNGDVAALKQIKGQPNASRGFRDSSGTDQNLNLDAQFAILSYVGIDSFCSSNAYVYGQGVNPVGGCVGDGYEFDIPDSLASNFQTADKDSDIIFNNLSSLASQASCGAGGPVGFDSSQVNKVVDLSLPATPSFGLPGDTCAVIYRYQPTVPGAKSIGGVSPGVSAPSISYYGGRATIMVDGDLTINNNIVYDMQGRSAVVNVADDLAQRRTLNTIPNLAIVVRGDVKIAANVNRIDALIYSSGVLSTCDSYKSGLTIGGAKSSTDAKACAVKPLVIRGGLIAKQGLQFGRNWYDVARIAGAYGLPGGANAFSNPDFDTRPVTPADPQGNYSSGPAESVIANGLSVVLPPPGLEDFGNSFTQPRYLKGEFTPIF